MRRILLTVAYDGTNYHGWQKQDNGDTIEGRLNESIKLLTGESVEVIGASRTDAGVSGLCNRAVFNTESTVPAENFARALNTFLPDDIRVRNSIEVSEDYHPRHKRTHKTYEYRIDNEYIANPIKTRHAWHVKEPLDVAAMDRAAKVLLGEHDFTSFCSVNGTTLTNIRTIIDISVEATEFDGGLDIVVRVTGNGFLYNMVRIIVGTLREVGNGKLTDADVQRILEGKDRRLAPMTAPPQGLTLVDIEDVDISDGGE